MNVTVDLSVLRVLVVALVLSLSVGCTREAARKIKDVYPLGSRYSDLVVDPEHILLDLPHPSTRGTPLVIGIKGYELPTRALGERERLVIVAAEFDLVAYLYFCDDGLLCAVEVLGS